MRICLSPLRYRKSDTFETVLERLATSWQGGLGRRFGCRIGRNDRPQASAYWKEDGLRPLQTQAVAIFTIIQDKASEGNRTHNRRFTKVAAATSNALLSLPLAPAADKAVPKTVPSRPEGETGNATSDHNGDSASSTMTTSTSNGVNGITTASSTTTRLAVLADLLADLPAAERREVIASLPSTDRAAIAKLLVSPQAQEARLS
jgi:hypothetical protein